MTANNAQFESPWPHRLAVLLCCATFPLIWVGGLVTSYKAGMSVYDWPNTFGYNLFLYPWKTWFYGPFDVFIEHGHRLFGALVGMITIVLVLFVFRYEQRRWMRVASVLALIAVIGQGTLGGMRVRMNEETFAMIHGCVGPAFLAFAVALAVFTSRYWREAKLLAPNPQSAKLQRLAISTAALTYLQLVLGAQLRHMSIDASATFFRVVLWAHLFVALAVSAHIILVSRVARKYFKSESRWLRPSITLLGIIGVQLLLGCAAYVTHYGFPAWVKFQFAQEYTVQAIGYWQAMLTTAHVAMGSLILGLSVMLSLRVSRSLRRVSHSAPASNLLMGAGA